MIHWNQIEWGTAADWVSGLGALAAAIVALRGHHLSKTIQRASQIAREAEERARDLADKQAAVRQIGIKLTKLASDSVNTLGTLSSREKPAAEWLECGNPIEILAAQPPIINARDTMSYALTAPEENLLLALNESEFLMDYLEAARRAQIIETALLEYSSRYQVVFSMLDGSLRPAGEHMWLDILKEDNPVVHPYAIQASSLIQAARQLTVQNVSILTQLCATYPDRMAKHFPDLQIPRISIDQPASDLPR